MSGHSKWATIHRKKGLLDEERGKIFRKIAKEIYVAARMTDGNPDHNPALRAVIEKAKSNNMPKDNIQKTIDKAIGNVDGVSYENIRYEGYAQGGVAIMVDTLTDNKNRTASMVRSTFTKNGGNLGTDGSVSYLFERKGVIAIERIIDEDTAMLLSLDNGALDFISTLDSYIIYTDPKDFLNIKEVFEQNGVNDFLTSEITYIATNEVTLDDDTKQKVLNLVSSLEELDDVQEVYYNLSE